jgi:hypothetical protein
MYRFKNGTFTTDIGARCHTQAANQTGTQV